MNIKSQIKQSILVLATAAFFSGCGQEAAIGEVCETASSKDECVDTAICTNESNENFVCRQSCTDQEDCPAGHNCNGISGSSDKSCQPD